MTASPGDPGHRIELRGVTVAVGSRTILDRVDLDIGRGVTAVVGPSGSGKSTLLRLLNRLDAPTAGTIRLDGTDVADLDPPSLRRRVAMVFQRPLVFPGDVYENLAVAQDGLDRAGARRALARVGLPERLLDQDAGSLSGGEGQRLALARVLLNEPEIVLADEITSMLDREAARSIEELVAGLATAGTDVVMVTHDGVTARTLARRIVVIADGTVRACGTPDELVSSSDPVVRSAIGAMP